MGVGRSCSSNISITVKPPLVNKWDLGGLKRNGWDPSGLKRDDSANTSAMEWHRNQTHQYHQVLFNFQHIMDFVGNYGSASMSSKMPKNPVIKASPFNNEERWLQARKIENKNIIPVH